MEEFLQRIEEVNNLINSGVAHYKQGNYNAARRNYLEAYEIFRNSYKKGGSSKENSGNILSNLRREDIVELADTLSILACHISTNNIDILDDLTKAVDLHEEEIRIRARTNDVFGRRGAEQKLIDICTRFRGEGETYLNRGLQNLERGNASDAIKDLKTAEHFYKSIKYRFLSPNEQSLVEGGISRINRKLKDSYAVWLSREDKEVQTIEWWQSAAKYFYEIDSEFCTLSQQDAQDENTKFQIIENLKDVARNLSRENNRQGKYKIEIDLLKSIFQTMCMLEYQLGKADVLLSLGNAYHAILTWQLLSMHQQMLKTPYLLDKSAFRLHSLLLPG